MKMTDVVELCESMGICPQPGPHGVQIGTTGFRIECGGGIAENLDAWWVRLIQPDKDEKPVGPLFTRSQLESALSRFRRP